MTQTVEIPAAELSLMIRSKQDTMVGISSTEVETATVTIDEDGRFEIHLAGARCKHFDFHNWSQVIGLKAE